MDATTDPVQEFVGEAPEGTDADEVTVELVDGDPPPPDSAVTRSSEEEGLTGTRSEDEGGPRFSTRSRGDHDLSDAEKASVMADNLLSDEARYARWQGRRPPVSHLQPGIVFPPGETQAVPLFDVGDRIVVEQRATDLGPKRPDPTAEEGSPDQWPWFRTFVGRVLSIDDDTGIVTVNDEEKCQKLGYSVWRSSARYTNENHRFFLAPKFGNPFDVSAVLAERREAERKKAQEAAGLPGAPKKRGRGRPPGAKNRPKEVIQAEKEAYRKSLEERRALRNARRGITG